MSNQYSNESEYLVPSSTANQQVTIQEVIMFLKNANISLQITTKKVEPFIPYEQIHLISTIEEELKLIEEQIYYISSILNEAENQSFIIHPDHVLKRSLK